jgi:uncharacterized coiled-coil protein SlyX
MENERLADIEIKISYIERAVSDLDQVMRGMSADLEVIKRELGRLRNLNEPQGTTAPANDKPPHY